MISRYVETCQGSRDQIRHLPAFYISTLNSTRRVEIVLSRRKTTDGMPSSEPAPELTRMCVSLFIRIEETGLLKRVKKTGLLEEEKRRTERLAAAWNASEMHLRDSRKDKDGSKKKVKNMRKLELIWLNGKCHLWRKIV